MMKFLFFLMLVFIVSCRSNKSIITKNVDIEVYAYENEGGIQASAMPKISSESKLNEYNRRFEYLRIKSHQKMAITSTTVNFYLFQG